MNDNKPMIPSVSVKYAHDGRSATADALGMRPMQARVWLQRGQILPGDPQRLNLSHRRMAGRQPVLFSIHQQAALFDALCGACNEFGYQLTDASIESWHLHWIIEHGFDPVAAMVGRLKNRMRQALNVGRIWTEGYYDSLLFEVAAVEARRQYIARHDGCRMTAALLRSLH